MNDPTENIRRNMVNEINTNPNEREALEEKYSKVYNTSEVLEDFELTGFMAPFVVAVRRSDSVKGTLMFQDQPRYYFNFQES